MPGRLQRKRAQLDNMVLHLLSLATNGRCIDGIGTAKDMHRLRHQHGIFDKGMMLWITMSNTQLPLVYS